MAERLDRRGFLRLGGIATLAAAGLGTACNAGGQESKTATTSVTKGKKTLRIAQGAHFVPAYDQWFDQEYVKRWGEEHDVDVVVDHILFSDLQARGDSEVSAGRGHDLFWFITPAAVLEDEVVDHRDIVEEVEAKLGKMTGLVERDVLNPKTGKYFGFPDFWVAFPVNYRVDLWSGVEPGARPATWDDIRRAAPKLKAAGHPVGIGLSPQVDSAANALAFMHAYGTSIQDEAGNVAIDSPATIEALKVASEVFRRGMTDEVLSWDNSADNRFLASGNGSLIIDPVGAMRAVEQQDPTLAQKIALAPLPAGPAGALGPGISAVYVIWKFSPNQELARQFLVDLGLNFRERFLHSEFYNLPPFPQAVPDLAELLAKDPAAPAGKYSLLGDAATWSTNVGHPGPTNSAFAEVFNQFLIPKMFAAVARGDMSPEDAVRAAQAQITPIFDKWRAKGKI
jgi:multiple sugar transport system substrate-binding protein